MEVALASDLGLGERFWARTNKIEAEGRSEFQLSVYSKVALMKWLEKPLISLEGGFSRRTVAGGV